MTEFSVTIKGKTYTKGHIGLLSLQRAMVLLGKIGAIEKKLGLALSTDATSEEYLESSPEDETLFNEYKRLWLVYVGFFIDKPSQDLGVDNLDFSERNELMSFFGRVQASTIERQKSIGNTSNGTEQKAA